MYIEKWQMSDGNNYGSFNIYKFVTYCKNIFLHVKDSAMLEIIFQTFFLLPQAVCYNLEFRIQKMCVFTILSQLEDYKTIS